VECTLPIQTLDKTLAFLTRANETFERRYPGDPPHQQPVHTVYGGAHLFTADTPRKLGVLALRSLDDYAPDASSFASALRLAPSPSFHRVYERVRQKLVHGAVEDLRVDFEDGYGVRPDHEEDDHCLSVAREFARGMRKETLPPFVGFRVKSLSNDTAVRSLRTLDLLLTALARETGGTVPNHFVVTLPKVVIPEQVSALVGTLDVLETSLGIPLGTIGIELMVEATQALVSARGEVTLAALLDAAKGRCRGAHFGAYDYTAGVDVAAAEQSLTHPWCDHARHVMQLAFARTGVRLSDGATNELPVAPHKHPTTEMQRDENRASVHHAWAVAYTNVQRALTQGFYQGWDLHPAQFPSRYAAVYNFFDMAREATAKRLRNFVTQAARATLVGTHFDDAATGQGLVNFFLRAVDAGALTEEEAAQDAGVSVALLRTRSFSRMTGAVR
jgi:hypothetical protein